MKFSLKALMLAVAACALLLSAGLEFAVWRPRRELIARHHEMKTYFDTEISRSAYYLHSKRLVDQMTRASAWHAERIRELRQRPGFDPARERASDLNHQPFDGDLRYQIILSRDAGERSF